MAAVSFYFSAIAGCSTAIRRLVASVLMLCLRVADGLLAVVSLPVFLLVAITLPLPCGGMMTLIRVRKVFLNCFRSRREMSFEDIGRYRTRVQLERTAQPK